MIKTIVCISGIIACVILLIYEIVEYIRMRNFEKAITRIMINEIDINIKNAISEWEKRFLK